MNCDDSLKQFSKSIPCSISHKNVSLNQLTSMLVLLLTHVPLKKKGLQDLCVKAFGKDGLIPLGVSASSFRTPSSLSQWFLLYGRVM